MTDRQERFCREYMKDHDARAAALRAGYGARRALRTAGELLNAPEVSAYIKEMEEHAGKRRVACTPEILEYFTKLMRDEVFEQRVEVDKATGKETVIRQPVKVADRTKAAEFLAKYYNVLGEKDADKGDGVIRVELDGDVEKWAK